VALKNAVTLDDVKPLKCENSIAVLDADFSGGGMASCRVQGDKFIVQIDPENDPINPSPWYAFRVTSKKTNSKNTANIKIQYSLHKHRYQPKVSTNLRRWEYLDQKRYSVSEDGQEISIFLPLSKKVTYLSAQELFVNNHYAALLKTLDKKEHTTLSVIGHSKEQRPLYLATSHAKKSKKAILLVGRQHPPEITGALAMDSFIKRIMADDTLAKEFRSEFNIFMVPNMNPDGVEHGFWRSNVGQQDLNRDWGPFTQPETQAIQALLGSLDDQSVELKLFLDFHSTKRNVFYTQTKEDEPSSYDFTGQWLENGGARLSGYDAERAERHNTDLPTSKNYMRTRYNIPAITYELGDETDRALLHKSAGIYAEEMMKILLQSH
jgi:predicted deacylase